MSRSDPVTVQIVRNRVSSLMEEMDYRFYRSGYSTIVRSIQWAAEKEQTVELSGAAGGGA